MEPGSVGQCIALFAASGVKKFFVWLSPGPDMAAVRGWLEVHGSSRIRRLSYPTLVRTAGEPVRFKTELRVCEVGVEEIEAARDQLGETLWPEYARSAAGTASFITWRSTERARSRSPRSRFLKTLAISLPQPPRRAIVNAVPSRP